MNVILMWRVIMLGHVLVFAVELDQIFSTERTGCAVQSYRAPTKTHTALF